MLTNLFPRLSWLLGLGLSLYISCAMPSAAADTNDVIARIREEGLQHSQVMETLSYLTDVIGPRLTGSPNHKRANEWTRDKLACWGLTNAHLEGLPFGRGWALKRFSVQVLEPQAFPLIAYPNAWSPGLEKSIVANVVYLDATSTNDLAKYKGTLAGAIVLVSRPREVEPPFDPMASRYNSSDLLKMANAGDPRNRSNRRGPSFFSTRLAQTVSKTGAGSGTNEQHRAVSTNKTEAAAEPSSRFLGRSQSGLRLLDFAMKEGAVLVVTCSPMGHGGTVFVSAASLPTAQATTNRTYTRPWSTNAPAVVPQITMAAEDYNRLVRMLKQGQKIKIAAEFQAQFTDADLMAYNTIAEIPGTDLKDEIVMLGAHLDSWQAGTGATDNGIGVAATMEAVRIIKALNLQPRRTIRIGLWTGEEQGFLGSKAYLGKHFGYWTNMPNAKPIRAPKDDPSKAPGKSRSYDPAPGRRLIELGDYQKLSAYFNLDNGAGKIRGICLQGDEALRPQFREWLQPFKDLDADTISLSNSYGTDHVPFDEIGLPGFQFIQDWIDYGRTHHSSQDVYDRVIAEDAKQASVVLAAFAYDAAMLDEKLTRKPLEKKLED